MAIPIATGLFITPGKQSQPFRQRRGSLAQYQMPARARGVSQDENTATEALMMTASYAAQEYNMDAAHHRSLVQSEAQSAYRTKFSELSNKFPDNPERWRTESMAAAQNILSSKTDKGNPLMDFLFNDSRSKEKMTANMKLFDATFEGEVQKGIGRKKLRQITAREIKLQEQMSETHALHKQHIANGASPTYLMNEQIRDSMLEVDKLVADVSAAYYLTTDDKNKFTDGIVERWGSTLVDLIQSYAPEQLKQNIETVEFIFSKNFANKKYTKYWDRAFQEKELNAMGEFSRATEATANLLQTGNAQHWRNELTGHAGKIEAELKASDGALSVERRAELYKETQAIQASLRLQGRKSTIARDDGTVPWEPLVDEQSVRKWGEASYDLLWAPVNRFLEKKLRDLSEDDNSESARLYVKELKTDSGSRWRSWRKLISAEERGRFLETAERFVTAERKKSRDEIRRRQTADESSLIKTAKMDLAKDLKNLLVIGDKIEAGPPGTFDTIPATATSVEEALIAGFSTLRKNLKVAGVSDIKINEAVTELKAEFADDSTIFAQWMRELSPEAQANSGPILAALLHNMTATGINRLLRQGQAHETAASAKIKTDTSGLVAQILAADKIGAVIDAESANKVLQGITTTIATLKGADVAHSLASVQIISNVISASNAITNSREADRLLLDKGVFLQDSKSYAGRIVPISEAIDQLDKIIADPDSIGIGVRSFVFTQGKGGLKVIDVLRERLVKSRTMLQTLNAMVDPKANLPMGKESAISWEDLSAYFGWDLAAPHRQDDEGGWEPVSAGDVLSTDVTDKTGAIWTRGQMWVKGIGSGDPEGGRAALTLLQAAPLMARKYVGIFEKAISLKSLYEPGGAANVIQFSEAANKLRAYYNYMEKPEETAISKFASAYDAGNQFRRADQEFDRARAIVDHLTSVRRDKIGIAANKFHSSFPDNDSRNTFIGKVADRLTGSDSPYKEMFRWETVHLSSGIYEAIRQAMMSLNADFADEYDLDDREEKQIDLIAEMLESNSVTSSILATPMPSAWSIGTHVTLKIGGAGPHLKGTALGQSIAIAAGGDAVSTAEMHGEAMLAGVLFNVVEQAIATGANPRLAVGAVSFRDVQHTFKGNWGLGRDGLFRAIDELIWTHERIPKEDWPKLNYNFGHPMSAFGFKGWDKSLFSADRDEPRVLRARREDSNETNLDLITNASMGRPILKNGKTQFTAVIRNQPKWQALSDVLTAAAQDFGISQSARDVMMLGEPTTIIVHGMQIPTSDDGSPYYKWLQRWHNGLKANKNRSALSTGRFRDTWSGDMTGVVTPYYSYVTNQKGEMFSRKTGDQIWEIPKPGSPLAIRPSGLMAP